MHIYNTLNGEACEHVFTNLHSDSQYGRILEIIDIEQRSKSLEIWGPGHILQCTSCVILSNFWVSMFSLERKKSGLQ